MSLPYEFHQDSEHSILEHSIKEDRELNYDEEMQLFMDIEEKTEKSKGRLHKSRERKSRQLLDAYMAEKRHRKLYGDLYDRDLGDKDSPELW